MLAWRSRVRAESELFSAPSLSPCCQRVGKAFRKPLSQPGLSIVWPPRQAPFRGPILPFLSRRKSLLLLMLLHRSTLFADFALPKRTIRFEVIITNRCWPWNFTYTTVYYSAHIVNHGNWPGAMLHACVGMLAVSLRSLSKHGTRLISWLAERPCAD